MAEQKKGLAGLALVLGGKPNGEPGGDSGEDVALSAKRDAMQRMFAAAKGGDWDGAAMAFKDAYDACAGHEESAEEEY